MRLLSTPASLRRLSSTIHPVAWWSRPYTLAQRWAARSRWWPLWRHRSIGQLTPSEREHAAWEACASEGAEVDWRNIELDGQRYGALYHNGTLIGLLPEAMSPQDRTH